MTNPTAGQPARVLHVITRLEPGGAQRNTLYTVEHLSRESFVAGLAWGPGEPLDEAAARLADVALFPVNDLVRPVALGKDLAAVRRLCRVMREFQPQVVHTHSSKAGAVGRLAARMQTVPVVVHSVHGFGFTPLQPLPVRALFFAVEMLLRPLTDHFVAVSRENLRLGVALGLFPERAVTLIRSGIELDHFRSPQGGEELRRRLGVPVGAPLVVQVGNFKPQKAPLDFVRVAARVAARVGGAHFVMVGDGPLRSRAEELAQELGVAGQTLFPGWLDDVAPLLAAADVSVLTSRHEGLPRAAVESLAAGVPVVATAVDGLTEVVRDGANGFLAAPGDVESLAAGVCRLLEQRELRTAMARAAREGLEEFDISLMVQKQEELYRWLLGCNRS